MLSSHRPYFDLSLSFFSSWYIEISSIICIILFHNFRKSFATILARVCLTRVSEQCLWEVSGIRRGVSLAVGLFDASKRIQSDWRCFHTRVCGFTNLCEPLIPRLGYAKCWLAVGLHVCEQSIVEFLTWASRHVFRNANSLRLVVSEAHSENRGVHFVEVSRTAVRWLRQCPIILWLFRVERVLISEVISFGSNSWSKYVLLRIVIGLGLMIL